MIQPHPHTIKERPVGRTDSSFFWKEKSQALFDFAGAQSAPLHVLVHVACLLGHDLAFGWENATEAEAAGFATVAAPNSR